MLSHSLSNASSLDAWAQHAASSGRVFHTSNLRGARPLAQYAVILTGAVRTFETCLPSLERTVLSPNAPVDVFFWLTISQPGPNAINETLAVRRSILTMPRRSLHIEQWGPGLVSNIGNDVPAVRRLCTGSAVQRCSDVRHGGSSQPLNLLVSWRKKALAWEVISHFVASGRQGLPYTAIFFARPDLSYPIEPLDLGLVGRVSTQHHAVLMPAAADFEANVINDQLAMGSPSAMESYLSAYRTCAKHDTQVSLRASHPCATTMAGWHAIQAGGFLLRRFWWQYWIVRPENVAYYVQHPHTFHLSWHSTACWQKPMWHFPTKDLSAFVNLNTTCTCSVDGLATRRPAVTLERLKSFCHYTQDYCSKQQGHRPCDMRVPPS